MERNPHRPNGADGGCDRHLGPSVRLEARDERTCGNLPLLDGPRLEEFIAIGSSRVSASWRASMSSLRRPDSVVGFIMIHYTNSPPSDHGRCEEGTARHRVLHGRWAYLDSRLPVAGVPRLGGHSYRIPGLLHAVDLNREPAMLHGQQGNAHDTFVDQGRVYEYNSIPTGALRRRFKPWCVTTSRLRPLPLD